MNISSTVEQLTRGWPQEPAQLFLEAVTQGSVIAIRRATSAVEALPISSKAPEIKLHIMASFNVESILPMLRLPLCAIPSRPTFEIAPFNSIETQLIDRKSMAYEPGLFANVVLWRLEEVFPGIFFPCSQKGRSLTDEFTALKSRITKMIEAYVLNSQTPLFLSTFPVPSTVASTMFASQQHPGVFSVMAALNEEFYRLASLHKQVHILDLFYWSAQMGAQACYDQQMDFLARQPFRLAAACALGLNLALCLRPLLVTPKKVLAVDLDDTLWGGILGEDGIGRLHIGNDFPGNIFLRIQREILELKHKGVLLVLLSKNIESDVQAAFNSMPDMLLKWGDFACQKVNFNHKYINLREAARELNLGIDSFVLLDDSHYEREQMLAFNPEVLVLNNGDGPLQMLRALIDTHAFDRHHLSEEDRNRHREYELRGARSIAGQEGSLEEFLISLQLKAQLVEIGEKNLDRVVQMLGKTNQFNLTTRRHRDDELRTILALPGAVGLTLRLTDKFGDQGIVGVIIAVPDVSSDILRVDSFLVSCRALGRGVERVLWTAMLRKAEQSGFKRLHAQYIPTAKNGLVRSLYEELGMLRDGEDQGTVSYKLEPLAAVPGPAWIEVNLTGNE